MGKILYQKHQICRLQCKSWLSKQSQRNQLSFRVKFKYKCCIIIKKTLEMSSQIQRYYYLIKQFEENLNIDETFDQAEELYYLKQFKLQKISINNCVTTYIQQTKKYEKGQINLQTEQWHKNQRKLFIYFLICYCKLYNTSPQYMVRNIFKQFDQEWNQLAHLFFRKNPCFLKFQGLSIMKKLKKTEWTTEEDELIKNTVKISGLGKWNQISKSLYYTTNCTKYFGAKQIRQRWYNHLNEKLTKDPWTLHEDLAILQHVLAKNKRWCQIVREFNQSRTEHSIKNRYLHLVRPRSESRPLKEAQRLRNAIVRVRNAINKARRKIIKSKKCSKSSGNACKKSIGSSVGQKLNKKKFKQIKLNQIKLVQNKEEGLENYSLQLKQIMRNQELCDPVVASNSNQLELLGLYFPISSQNNGIQYHTNFLQNFSSPTYLINEYFYPQTSIGAQEVNFFQQPYLLFTTGASLESLTFLSPMQESRVENTNAMYFGLLS